MRLLILVALVMTTNTAVGADDTGIDAETVANFAGLALQCIHQEYPNKIGHTMQSDSDVAPPRVLHPAFHGCFDWHSSVHGHWLLTRLARLHPDASFAEPARAALESVGYQTRDLLDEGPLAHPLAIPEAIPDLLELLHEGCGAGHR